MFSACDVIDMYTEEQGERVFAKIRLEYAHGDLDLEVGAEALEYVMENPVSVGGFRDFLMRKRRKGNVYRNDCGFGGRL